MSETDLISVMTARFDSMDGKLEAMRAEQRQDTKELWEAMRSDRDRCDQRHADVNTQLDEVCGKVATMNGMSREGARMSNLVWAIITALGTALAGIMAYFGFVRPS
jgi:hypothetical protein